MNENDQSVHWRSLAEPLICWYQANHRPLPWRQSPTPYQTWISEIMLQQTRVEAVKGYYSRFLTALPDVEALANAEEEQLMKLWEGLGYYSRARNLQKCARILMEHHQGQLPADYHLLQSLPGIGPYTAGAIASIAFGLPVPAVDGNVLRVYSRCQADYRDITLPETKKWVTTKLTEALESLPQGISGDFNQAVMELGATVCLPNGKPHCEACPIAEFCAGRIKGCMLDLPVRGPKKGRRLEALTVLLIVRDGYFALRKRPEKGLLAGLWELPNISGHLTGQALLEAIRAFGVEPLRIEPLGPARHIFTHVEWQMQGYRITAETCSQKDMLHWVGPEEKKRYALPSAFRYYLSE
ncbi:MAG: A/G-specific adenine glycosylase [Oscillospiraceae bacterium]|nr:A/G-specific adenine glycosylase [Oscillospiraceae bacterium]RKJ54684.1 A/G-specific adenine glycosylase [bacterium 1XD42-8]RKJ63639.1 A/G-specific adenine glycosylase [bacterium 1XD42-1]